MSVVPFGYGPKRVQNLAGNQRWIPVVPVLSDLTHKTLVQSRRRYLCDVRDDFQLCAAASYCNKFKIAL